MRQKKTIAPLNNCIRTKKQLYAFAKNAFGLKFARRPTCPDHSAPLDCVWDFYSGNVQNAVVTGSRLSGKTMMVAFLHALFGLTHENCESVSIGAETRQAEACYEAFRKLLIGHAIFDKYVPPPQTPQHTRERLFLKTGSVVRILPATERAMNSPHPHKVFFDEVDQMDWNVLQEGLSMVRSDPIRGLVGQQMFISSLKRTFGPLTRLTRVVNFGSDPESGISLVGGKVYRWCLFEVMQKQNPTANCPCRQYCKTLSSGETLSFYDICQQRCANADGFMPLSDILQKFILVEEPVFKSQWLSQDPMPAYAVFSIHPHSYLQKTWDWRAIPNSEIIIGVDIGFSAPTVFVILQILPSGIVIVIEEYRKYGMPISALIREAVKIQQVYQPRIWVFDPRATLAIKEFIEAGFRAQAAPMLYANTAARLQEKLNRIRVIQSALDLHFGMPRLYFIVDNCIELLKEMKDYAFITDSKGIPTEKLPDGHDDGIDALSYAYSFLEAAGRLKRPLSPEAIQQEYELLKPHIISDPTVGQIIAPQVEDWKAQQLENTKDNLRKLLSDEIRKYRGATNENIFTPNPEVFDDKMLEAMGRIKDLYQIAQNPDIPHEEKAKILSIIADMERDLARAWEIAEVQTIVQQQVLNPSQFSLGEPLPTSFIDLLLRIP